MPHRWTRSCANVRGDVAYFTTQPLDKQWGDDWNDAPYEHNAGCPYGPHSTDAESWEIHEVTWVGPFETPDEWGLNSPFSVQQINARCVPWLNQPRWGEVHGKCVWAGTTLRDFVQIVESVGGEVRVSRELAPLMMSRRKYMPLPCKQCGAMVDGQRLRLWHSAVRRGLSTNGPFCGRKCASDFRRVYPDPVARKRERSREWERQRRDAGVCVACGQAHDRGTFRCRRCARKAGKRNGLRYDTYVCGKCGGIGHNRRTCNA